MLIRLTVHITLLVYFGQIKNLLFESLMNTPTGIIVAMKQINYMWKVEVLS